MFYEDDYPSWVDEMFETCCTFGICNNAQLERIIWAIARQNTDIPHIGNIKVGVILNRIKDGFTSKYEKDYDLSSIEIYVNAMDTHFYFDGESCTTYQELLDLLDEFKKDNL